MTLTVLKALRAPPPAPPSRYVPAAQQRTERKAAVTFVLFTAFLMIAPGIPRLMEGKLLAAFWQGSILALVLPAWWLWLFRWSGIVRGVSMLITPELVVADVERHRPRIEAILAGWVATQSELAKGPVWIRLRPGFEDRLPYLTGRIETDAGARADALPEDLAQALTWILTEDGNPYRLKGIYWAKLDVRIDLEGASMHRRFEIARSLQDALEESRMRLAQDSVGGISSAATAPMSQEHGRQNPAKDH